jgi:hypothetical protein
MANYCTFRSRIFRRRHHCRWRAVKFKPILGAQGLWAGRDLYRATPAVFRSHPKDHSILSHLALGYAEDLFYRIFWYTRQNRTTAKFDYLRFYVSLKYFSRIPPLIYSEVRVRLFSDLYFLLDLWDWLLIVIFVISWRRHHCRWLIKYCFTFRSRIFHL